MGVSQGPSLLSHARPSVRPSAYNYTARLHSSCSSSSVLVSLWRLVIYWRVFRPRSRLLRSWGTLLSDPDLFQCFTFAHFSPWHTDRFAEIRLRIVNVFEPPGYWPQANRLVLNLYGKRPLTIDYTNALQFVLRSLAIAP